MRMQGFVLGALLIATSLSGQDKTPPAGHAEMSDCMKHCQQMASARQKAEETRIAARQKMEATFQEVRAELDTARSARGEKKVAALESALEKLVSFHESMHAEMESAMAGGPGRMGHMGMGMGMTCCGAMAAMEDCPMMKGGSKPQN